jgi:DNA polymerase alpha-associated DNA helicase A
MKTGKTFTLVEIIRQLVLVQGKRVLVCGASNLAVGTNNGRAMFPLRLQADLPNAIFIDNLLARLSPLFPPKTLLRLGHPARISPLLLPRTLDYQASHSDEAELVKDVKIELEGNMKTLSKGKGEKGRVWGKERGKVWDDVRELRKEWVWASGAFFVERYANFSVRMNRYRTREAKVVKNVVSGAQVCIIPSPARRGLSSTLKR